MKLHSASMFTLAAALSWAACAAPRAVPRNVPNQAPVQYAYDPTQPTDGNFDYGQYGAREKSFEWRTLNLVFENQVFSDGGSVVFVIDMKVRNQGTKPFIWEDYVIFMGLPLDSGEFDYRLLFTQAKVTQIKPKETVVMRYVSRIPGISLPERFVVVVQSLFGGRDAGFAFAGHPVAAAPSK